jgi:hypothetical protein
VFRDAEAVIDRGIAAGGVEPGGTRGCSCAGTPDVRLDSLRASCALFGDEQPPLVLELGPGRSVRGCSRSSGEALC